MKITVVEHFAPLLVFFLVRLLLSLSLTLARLLHVLNIFAFVLLFFIRGNGNVARRAGYTHIVCTWTVRKIVKN